MNQFLIKLIKVINAKNKQEAISCCLKFFKQNKKEKPLRVANCNFAWANEEPVLKE